MLSLVPFDIECIDTTAPGGMDALQSFVRRVYHFGKLAEKAPLSAGYSFAFRWSPPTPLPTSQKRRFLPAAFTVPADVHLILHRQLLSNSSIMSSDVWLANVITDGDVSASLVVVKFIQPSQMASASATEFFGSVPERWAEHTSPDYLARREAAGYDRLYDLQGSVIPYFFGKDIVITPCGEPAWVLVTEYIEGESLGKLLQVDRSSWSIGGHFPGLALETLGPMFKAAHEGLVEIHKRFMLHGDPAPRNVIIPTQQPDQAVWIDISGETRDIESDAVWGKRAIDDSGEFRACVFFDQLHCDDCQRHFNRWCLDHIADHQDVYTPGFDVEWMAYVNRIRSLAADEEPFREAHVETALALGLNLEANPPSHGLVPQKSASGTYDTTDSWLILGDHPEFGTLPISKETKWVAILRAMKQPEPAPLPSLPVPLRSLSLYTP